MRNDKNTFFLKLYFLKLLSMHLLLLVSNARILVNHILF